MLDVTSMLATLPLLGPNEYALTNSFNSMLMSATPLYSEVVIEAEVVRNGRNLIFTQATAWKINDDHTKTKIASAQLSKFRLTHQW
ncbi:hypothetical protein D9M69_735440 [compost metagenome]